MSPWVPGLIAAFFLAYLRRRYVVRQGTISADRVALDRIIDHMASFDRNMRSVVASAVSTPTNTHPGVPALRDAWNAAEDGANAVGRVSGLRYDGLRTLGLRIADACTATSAERLFLENAARGSDVVSWNDLEEAFPWEDLRGDMEVFKTLAILYRREGPLTPWQPTWWRRRRWREGTPPEIVAPIQERANKLRRRQKRDDDENVVTSFAQTKAIIEANPNLQDLSIQETNAIAYRTFYYGG